jgi:hypothetical protein
VRTSRQRQYGQYLKSDIWRKKSSEVKKKRGNKCQECGSFENIEVHHLSYSNLGNELNDDLAVLCRNCHEEAHEGERIRRQYVKAFETWYCKKYHCDDPEYATDEDWFDFDDWLADKE